MGNELYWNGDFKPELVGNYRNYQVISYRELLIYRLAHCVKNITKQSHLVHYNKLVMPK